MAINSPPPVKVANVAPPQPPRVQENKQAAKKQEAPPPPPPAPSVNTSGQVTGTTISTSA